MAATADPAGLAASGARLDARPFARAQSASAAFDGRRAFVRYLAWVPLLWIFGLNIIVGLFLVVRMAAARWPTDLRTNALAGLWLAAALAQASSVAWNWSQVDQGVPFLLSRLLSMTTLGWLFAGIAIAAGRGWSMSGPRAVRGVMVFALHVAWVGSLILGTGVALGIPSLHLPTPVSAVLGSSSFVEFYTVLQLLNPEESSLGLPRIALFFPWPTALSLAGICLVHVATCERDRFWRMAGYAGGFVAIAFSFSRAGYAILPVSLVVASTVRAKPAMLGVLVIGGCVAGLACVMLNIYPPDLFNEMVTTMRQSRAGSSMARDQIYQASWDGFLASPVFGWGWVGDSVISQEMIPIGSHSSVYGTLYTGGLVTFCSVALAGFATLAVAVWNAVKARTTESAAGAGIMVAVVMFAYGEAMYSLVPALLFAFMFVGGALGSGREEAA